MLICPISGNTKPSGSLMNWNMIWFTLRLSGMMRLDITTCIMTLNQSPVTHTSSAVIKTSPRCLPAGSAGQQTLMHEPRIHAVFHCCFMRLTLLCAELYRSCMLASHVQTHRWASITRKFLKFFAPSCCLLVDIIFIFATLGICSWRNRLQFAFSKRSRLAGEICYRSQHAWNLLNLIFVLDSWLESYLQTYIHSELDKQEREALGHLFLILFTGTSQYYIT